MKKEITLPGVCRNVACAISMLLGLFISMDGFGQFTVNWPLTANQTFTTSGAQAANVVGTNQAMSSTLFIPASNAYVGVTSGTAGDGQRCSPKLNDGNDGGWIIDGAAVEGRYEEFVTSPATGFNLTVTDINFYIGNRSTSNLRASAYYYVVPAATASTSLTIAMGTALGVGIRPGSSTNQWVQFSYSSLNIAVPNGSKIIVRIYPYMTGSATTGKYFCTKQVNITGTTSSPNISNIVLATPATCASDRLTISWTGPVGYNPATTTILAFLKAGAPTVGTPTNALSFYTANTAFPSGTGYQNDGLARCIYKGTGTDAFGNHSGLLVTGLAANTSYTLLIFAVTNATNAYSPTTGVTASGNTLAAALAEPTNHVTAITKGAITTSNIPLNWTAAVAGAQAPTGYMLRASTVGTPADPVDGTDITNQTDLTTGNGNVKVTPNTATGYSSFTGLAAGTMYNFRINSYTNAASCINYKAAGLTANFATLPNAAITPSMSISGATGTISWTQGAGYVNANHTTLVFVKNSTTAISTGSPSANPAGYAANTVVGAGTAYEAAIDPAAYCVYNGDATSVNVSGLVASSTYQVLVLTVMSSPNSDGTYSYSAYATTLAAVGTTYTWIGGATGAWGTTTNWSPTRTTPSTTDILIFNTGTTVTPATVVTQTIAQLVVTNNTTLNLATAIRTLTIATNNGLLNPDLVVDAGSSLSLQSVSNVLVLANNSSASIAGSFTINAGATFNTNYTGCVTTLSGTIRNLGQVLCNASNMLVTGTGVYEHAINGGTIPTATWNTGSTCIVSGITSATTIDGHRQSFSNFIWDCSGQTATPFVLGSATTNASVVPPVFEANDNFIVRRTGTGLLQLTSSSGQRDVNCGNYQQYGGQVAITYNTNDAGGQRSLTVYNNFYVTDSLATSSRFFIVSNAVGNTTNGRLYVGGNVMMRLKTVGNTVSLEKSGTTSNAQIWFTGSANQQVNFNTITGDIDFVTAQASASNNVLLNTNATAANFLLTNGIFNIGANTLTINNAVSYPTPATGLLAGTSASNLTMNLAGNAGTLNFASSGRTLRNLVQAASNTITLGTELGITAGTTPGSVTLGSSAVLNTGNNLILRSDANGTSRIAPLPVDGSGNPLATINGTVTVERHLPMNPTYDSRRWRLLTAPFRATASPTINAGWQEGVFNINRLSPNNPRPGYGTIITKSTVAANGFDQGTTSNSSIYYFNNATNSWIAPANTNVVKLSDNNSCYMLFARGDRSIVVSSQYVAANSTTLAPKGQLNTGRVTIPMVSSGFQAVGNPYASQIKLDNVSFNGTLGKSATIYLWDPKTLGTFNVGKFITCSGDGSGGYTYTANTSNFGSNPGVIESSGAFMIAGTGGNIIFNESDKTSNSSTIGIASRPADAANSFGRIRKLYADLYAFKNGVPALADGIAVTYNRHYSNGKDAYDAVKFSSFSTKEQLSIRSNDELMAIERRNNIRQTDTVFLVLEKMNQAQYQFVFRPEAFEGIYSAQLEDTYLQTYTPISLNTETTIGFNITAADAAMAENRFRIVFTKATRPKQVNLIVMQNDRSADLQWTCTDTEAIEPQVVERSTDGIHFTVITTEAPNFNELGDPVYNWTDAALAPGNYYYRIGFNDEAGKMVYSNIVKVSTVNRSGQPAILPNPVTNGIVNLYMAQLPTGMYDVSISNAAGQTVYSNRLSHQQANSNQQLILKNQYSKGIYQLTLRSADGKPTVLKLMLQ